MAALLTILICTHNRADLLQKVLASLNTSQRPDSREVDILVVANACTDATHAKLEDYRRRAVHERFLPLTWLAERTPGKSHALNRGAEALEGDWVAVVDDDHRVSADFLVRIDQAISMHRDASMLCGRILPDWDGREPAWVHDTGPHRVYPLPIPRQDFGEKSRELGLDGPIPGGGNQIMRVDVLRRLGAFSTELGPQGHDLGGGEDTEYMLRALRAGERLWYVPEVLQYHHVDLDRLGLRYLMRKAYHRSASSVVLNREAGDRGAGVPLYLYRKLAGYAASALLAASSARRRFFLVRSAAALGEMAGHRRRQQPGHHATLPAHSDHA